MLTGQILTTRRELVFCSKIAPDSPDQTSCRFCHASQVNPEAPAGSFRKRDLQQEERDRASGKQARVGLDGKVYQFIDAPSDDEKPEAESPCEGAVCSVSCAVSKGFAALLKKLEGKAKKNKDAKKGKKAKQPSCTEVTIVALVEVLALMENTLSSFPGS